MPNTKQLRLSDQTLIRQRIKEFLGKKINIVLSDNRVILGDLHGINQEGITLINMRQRKVHYSFDELYEVYFDTFV